MEERKSFSVGQEVTLVLGGAKMIVGNIDRSTNLISCYFLDKSGMPQRIDVYPSVLEPYESTASFDAHDSL